MCPTRVRGARGFGRAGGVPEFWTADGGPTRASRPPDNKAESLAEIVPPDVVVRGRRCLPRVSASAATAPSSSGWRRLWPVRWRASPPTAASGNSTAISGILPLALAVIALRFDNRALAGRTDPGPTARDAQRELAVNRPSRAAEPVAPTWSVSGEVCTTCVRSDVRCGDENMLLGRTCPWQARGSSHVGAS
jgi:hypothetical protein